MYAEGKGQFRSIAKMSVRANILNMSKIYDHTISQSAIMLFMNHQGPLEAPSMVACFHHKIPTGLYFVQDAAGLFTGRLFFYCATLLQSPCANAAFKSIRLVLLFRLTRIIVN